MSLYDKVSGSYTSATPTSITDSSASWTVNQFEKWFVTVNSTEYLVVSNTIDTLTFDNSLSATGDYKIAFIGREYLTEIESDCSDTVKIPDALILKKYNQANIDMQNKTFAYLRKLCKSDFDPLDNILNLDVMQRSYAYYMLYLIYTDLTLQIDSFNTFKTEGFYERYKETVKDALALLQIDFNENGVADCSETSTSVGGTSLTR